VALIVARALVGSVVVVVAVVVVAVVTVVVAAAAAAAVVTAGKAPTATTGDTTAVDATDFTGPVGVGPASGVNAAVLEGADDPSGCDACGDGCGGGGSIRAALEPAGVACRWAALSPREDMKTFERTRSSD